MEGKAACLLELALTGADADLPAVIDLLIDPRRVLVLQVEPHIVLEGLDGQQLAIQVHLLTQESQPLSKWS